MKYRIIRLGSRDHGVSAGYHLIQRQLSEKDAWEHVSGSTVCELQAAEQLLAELIAQGQTEDEIVKEVTV